MKKQFMDIIDSHVGRSAGWKRLFLNEIIRRGRELQVKFNKTNDDGIVAMDKLATKVSTLREKMHTATQITLSTNSLSGNSNTQFFVSEQPVLELNNMSIGNNILIASSIRESFQIYGVNISSNGQLGNSVDFNERRYYDKSTISTSTHVEIESFNSGLNAVIELDIKTPRVVNAVEFGIKDLGVNAPDITHLEVSKDGVSYSRRDVVVESLQDKLILIFQDSMVEKIRFGISQQDGYVSKSGRKRFAVGIHSLRAGIRTSEEAGSVVFGPINSSKEILKASISASIPNDGYSLSGLRFELSHNNSNWHELTVPNSISPKKKIVDFNNYADGAIKTDLPVKALYLKVTSVGNKIKKKFSTSSIYNTHTQTISNSIPTISIPFEVGAEHIVARATGVIYGSRVAHNSYTDNTSMIDCSESIMVDGQYVPKSISALGAKQNVRIKYSPAKCVVEKSDTYRIISPYGTDVSSARFFKYSLPVKRDVRVSDYQNVVLPFREAAGLYSLTDGSTTRVINLGSGFFSSCYQWMYSPHSKDVSLVSPSGRVVHTFAKNRWINLLDYFTIEEPVYSEQSDNRVAFNRSYPEADLGTDEFTIVDGRIFSSSTNAIISAYVTIRTEIKTESKFGVGQIIFESDDVSLASHKEELVGFDGKKSAKLKYTGLVRGSIEFDFSGAAIATLNNEVEFINGSDEFKSGGNVEVAIPAASNRFSLGRHVDRFANIRFVGATAVFRNRVYSEGELLEYGDYMLSDISQTETEIVLPSGVTTDDIIRTSAVLDIKNESSNSGDFSVDYANGIIYSQSVIDGSIVVKYKFSNVFMEGKEAIYIPPEEYAIDGRQITFSSPDDGATVIVISKISESFDLDIHVSPRLSNLTLNTVVL